MTTENAHVIVGAGLAGAKAAEALRTEGFDGPVIMIGEEADRPYERPPLSKEYLLGKADRETIFVHPQGWYAEHEVDLRLGTSVTGVDPTTHQVSLSDGSRVGYARLLLATGSAPRHLTVPGAGLRGLHYLRNVGDSDQIKAALSQPAAPEPRVVVIGAGWIGLEVAAAARAANAEVTVLEAADLPLLRVLGPEVAQIFAALHRDNGVDLRIGTKISRITGSNGRADGVRLSDGSHVRADIIVAGIGISPRTQLAAEAGLDVTDGITVGADLRTSDPDIFAAGDVACAFHPLLGKHIRVEHWANALHQPEAAARAMLGEPVSYDRVPYFFTDQYELGMEYSGYAEPGGYDEVIFRGDVSRHEFVAFWLGNGGRVLAGMNVNIWDAADAIAALIRAGRPVDKAALRDPQVSLDSLASR